MSASAFASQRVPVEDDVRSHSSEESDISNEEGWEDDVLEELDLDGVDFFGEPLVEDD